MFGIKSYYAIENEPALLDALYESPRSADTLLAAVKPLKAAFGDTKNVIRVDMDGEIQVCVQWPHAIADDLGGLDKCLMGYRTALNAFDAWWMKYQRDDNVMIHVELV